MKQCPDCKTFKKADNCIRCGQKARSDLDDTLRELREVRITLQNTQATLESTQQTLEEAEENLREAQNLIDELEEVENDLLEAQNLISDITVIALKATPRDWKKIELIQNKIADYSGNKEIDHGHTVTIT